MPSPSLIGTASTAWCVLRKPRAKQVCAPCLAPRWNAVSPLRRAATSSLSPTAPTDTSRCHVRSPPGSCAARSRSPSSTLRRLPKRCVTPVGCSLVAPTECSLRRCASVVSMRRGSRCGCSLMRSVAIACSLNCGTTASRPTCGATMRWLILRHMPACSVWRPTTCRMPCPPTIRWQLRSPRCATAAVSTNSTHIYRLPPVPACVAAKSRRVASLGIRVWWHLPPTSVVLPHSTSHSSHRACRRIRAPTG